MTEGIIKSAQEFIQQQEKKKITQIEILRVAITGPTDFNILVISRYGVSHYNILPPENYFNFTSSFPF